MAANAQVLQCNAVNAPLATVSLSYGETRVVLLSLAMLLTIPVSLHDGPLFDGTVTQAAAAVTSTHISACVGAITWFGLGWLGDHKWSVTHCLNGAFAGLAAITPGSGFVHPRFRYPVPVSVRCSASLNSCAVGRLTLPSANARMLCTMSIANQNCRTSAAVLSLDFVVVSPCSILQRL